MKQLFLISLLALAFIALASLLIVNRGDSDVTGRFDPGGSRVYDGLYRDVPVGDRGTDGESRAGGAREDQDHLPKGVVDDAVVAGPVANGRGVSLDRLDVRKQGRGVMGLGEDVVVGVAGAGGHPDHVLDGGDAGQAGSDTEGKDHHAKGVVDDAAVAGHVADDRQVQLDGLVVREQDREYSFEDIYKICSVGDYKKAYLLIYQEALKGNNKAQFLWGYMNAKGLGVPQDYVEAAKWYRMAAEQGNVFAQNNLGLMYESGEGVTQDIIEGAKWYRKAAEQGNALAQYNLGLLHDKGNGVPQDSTQAAKWYLQAAQQGNVMAQYRLASLYRYGEGVPQNDEESARWYLSAAEQGNAQAQVIIGIMYLNGQGVINSHENAYAWWLVAGENLNGAAREYRNAVMKNMTPEQIKRGQETARKILVEIGRNIRARIAN
jgi:TPR repeat protein